MRTLLVVIVGLAACDVGAPTGADNSAGAEPDAARVDAEAQADLRVVLRSAPAQSLLVANPLPFEMTRPVGFTGAIGFRAEVVDGSGATARGWTATVTRQGDVGWVGVTAAGDAGLLRARVRLVATTETGATYTASTLVEVEPVVKLLISTDADGMCQYPAHRTQAPLVLGKGRAVEVVNNGSRSMRIQYAAGVDGLITQTGYTAPGGSYRVMAQANGETQLHCYDTCPCSGHGAAGPADGYPHVRVVDPLGGDEPIL